MKHSIPGTTETYRVAAAQRRQILSDCRAQGGVIVKASPCGGGDVMVRVFWRD